MRTVKVNLLRAMTYVDGYYDINKGLEYAMKAYNDPSIKNDTLPQITIARMLTALNYALSRFSQACSMATEGHSLHQIRAWRPRGGLPILRPLNQAI